MVGASALSASFPLLPPPTLVFPAREPEASRREGLLLGGVLCMLASSYPGNSTGLGIDKARQMAWCSECVCSQPSPGITLYSSPANTEDKATCYY